MLGAVGGRQIEHGDAGVDCHAYGVNRLAALSAAPNAANPTDAESQCTDRP
jgi:hypothetical protein